VAQAPVPREQDHELAIVLLPALPSLHTLHELEDRIAAFGARYSSLGKPFARMFTRQELERRLRDPLLDTAPASFTSAA
jgi:hypothetical protein